jgi:hypothetical protein
MHINVTLNHKSVVLELAEVPLSFLPKAGDEGQMYANAIDVQKFHPQGEERIEVRRRNVQQNISINPVISALAPGIVQVEVSGLGKTKTMSGLESYQISMFGTRHHRNKARGASLTW